MTTTPPARPACPVRREAAAAAGAQGALAAAGLAWAVATIDGPARALLLWAVASAVVGAAQAARAGWLGSEPAPPRTPGARREDAADTVRRTGVLLAPALVLQVAALVVGAGLGAIVAGVLTGTALGELRALRLTLRREEREDAELLRELGPHPFAGPRRPLYTRPRSESTLAT